MTEKQNIAQHLMDEDFNCSQSVFAAFAEDYDIDMETALKVSTGFGGGMRSGEVCGALTGALMAIGAARGHHIAGDTGAKEDGGLRARAFVDLFRERNGAILCRDLLGFDPSTEEGHAHYFAHPELKVKCRDFVNSAVELLEELGY